MDPARGLGDAAGRSILSFYPSAALLRWLQAQGWHYRLRLKGNLRVDVGEAGIETAADLARSGGERFVPRATLFEEGIATAIGVVHEPGHPEPWIIALDATPSAPRCSTMAHAGRSSRFFRTSRAGAFGSKTRTCASRGACLVWCSS